MNYDKILCGRVAQVPPSGIRKFFDIVSEMQGVISLGVGEPDFNTPWDYTDAAIYSLRKGRTHYTGNRGLPELMRLIARYEAERHGVHYDPKTEIMATVGASEGIDLALRAIVEPGDEVIVPDPSYVSYMPGVAFANGVCVPAPTYMEDQFRLTPQALRTAITPRTKALILPYPNNPTGAAYTKAQLEKWVAYALKKNAVILYDAAYECFAQDGAARSIYEAEGAEKCAVEFCSFSKTAGFTGTRCGYTVVPSTLVVGGVSLKDMWYRRQSTKTNGVSYVVQRGAAAVFTEEGERQIGKNLAFYRENARIIAACMENCGISYTGGKNSPYIWLKCPDGMKSWEFFDYLLNEAQVVGTPGSGFGRNGEGYFRLTAFGSRETTKEACERIERLLKK